MTASSRSRRRSGRGRAPFRPVLMTALAMIIGMIPMALGLGEGGEQNAPLGRAVIGGLLFATVTTLLFVPLMYSLLRRKAPVVDAAGQNLCPPPVTFAIVRGRLRSPHAATSWASRFPSLPSYRRVAR